MIVMLTFEEAKRIGLDACVNRLGREFVMKYKDTSCPAYGDMDDRVFCFLGVDNSESRYVNDDKLVLDGGSSWPYSARCTVKYNDGTVDFLECKLPSPED